MQVKAQINNIDYTAEASVQVYGSFTLDADARRSRAAAR
jgi:hypothetical protein